MHPYHNENAALLRRLLMIVPSAQVSVLEPIGYQLNAPFKPIDPREFVTETKGGRTKKLTVADDIIWQRGDLAKKSFKVLDMSQGHGEPIALPTGAGGLRLEGEVGEMVPMIFKNLRDLFGREKARPTEGLSFPGGDKSPNSKKILGYSKGAFGKNDLKHTMPTIADLLSYLDPATRNFIVSVAKAVADFFGIQDHERILKWTMILIEYPPQSGFNWHVDGISDFGHYPGIVINIAVGQPGTLKGFDLRDLMGSQTTCRQVLQQGDVAILSGAPRIGSAHSVPKMSGVQYTVAFKLPFEDLSGPETPPWIKAMAKDPQVDFDRPVYSVDFTEAYRMQTLTKRMQAAVI
jgi:hypothetical protein